MFVRDNKPNLFNRRRDNNFCDILGVYKNLMYRDYYSSKKNSGCDKPSSK